ncbi:MAG: hypothetical protein IRY99_18660 [Isosphaeraceae bacterium]|nr:hypothetical protein [Isosphaeraceae bacterium]
MKCMFRLAVFLILVLDLAGTTWAQVSAPVIDRVEEDWELTIAEPDVAGAGPQITTTMSPAGDNAICFVAFNLNYRDSPFQAGGLQTQAWAGRSTPEDSKSQGVAQCSTSGETISWTQVLALSGGQVTYDIKNGDSTTWGQFGQGGNLKVAFAAPLTSLAAYSPDVSVAKSGVGWQSNRVTSMTLVRIRYYAGSTLVRTDSTPRPVNLSR